MSRKSIQALATVTPLKLEAPRLQPPATLSAFQAEVWRRTVRALPGDWFGVEHIPLLTEYCRQVERAAQVDVMVAAAVDDVDQYAKLTRVGMALSATIAQLCRAMRITQQAQVKPETAGKRSQGAGVRGVEAIYEYEEADAS
jgi:hypothetical protein